MYSTNYVEANMQACGWMRYVIDFAQLFRIDLTGDSRTGGSLR